MVLAWRDLAWSLLVRVMTRARATMRAAAQAEETGDGRTGRATLSPLYPLKGRRLVALTPGTQTFSTFLVSDIDASSWSFERQQNLVE